MNRFQRQHPLFIVHAFSKYLLLLLLPLLRSLVLLRGSVIDWLEGAWFDLLVVGLIIGAGWLQWYCTRYSLQDRGVSVDSGIFIQRACFIPYKNLSSIATEEPFYLRPLRITRVRMETDGGSTARADVTLLLRRVQAEDILRAGAARLAEGENGPQGVRTYRPKTLYIAILSLITSNTLTGVLFASTFISQTGKVLGEEFERLLVDSITRLVQILAFNIPPAAAMAAAVLLGGWGIAFLITMVSHLRFRATREGRLLSIRAGIIAKKEYYLAVERINYILLRQNLFTKLCGFCSVLLNCTGYGKEKHELAVLLPAAGEKELRKTLRMILPEFKVSPRKYKPFLKVVTRFLIPPVSLILAIAALFLLLWLLFPSFFRTILFLGIMAEIPAVWWFFVKIAAYHHVGVGIKGDIYTFRATFGYAFLTMTLHKDKIAKAELRQSLFQKMSRCADLLVYTFSEQQQHVRIHNLRAEEAKEFMRVFGNHM